LASLSYHTFRRKQVAFEKCGIEIPYIRKEYGFQEKGKTVDDNKEFFRNLRKVIMYPRDFTDA
jgi:hypothetical protein